MPKPRRNTSSLIRKHLVVDQRKLDAARKALGTVTDSATIDAALEAVVLQAEIDTALDKAAAANAFGASRS